MSPISIIFPVWNESARLPNSLPLILVSGPHEFVFVVEKSSDQSVQVLRDFWETHPLLPGQSIQIIEKITQDGKGATIRQGVFAATREVIVFSDIDLSCPLDQLSVLVNPLMVHSDQTISIASRMLPQSQVHRPWWRTLVSRGFNLWVRLLLQLPYSDTQCGFKAFTKKAALMVFQEPVAPGFEFDVEILLRAKKMNLKVVEVPIRWVYSPGSSVHPIFDVFRMFFGIIRYRRNF